jgi:imidazole glycerol-phosphate synthase subunit HisH
VLAGPALGQDVAKHERAIVIAIVDFHAGNLTSVKKALDRIGAESFVTSDPEAIAGVDKIVLPGVGHFAATKVLEASGMRTVIAAAIQKEVPFLGICVGMQWLFESSEESPATQGLGIFAGQCAHFPAEVKSPHVGWNDLLLENSTRLLAGVPQSSFVYFTHTYRAPVVKESVARCEYGGVFSAAVERGRVFGVQFHPEKSGDVGQAILRNFHELPC